MIRPERIALTILLLIFLAWVTVCLVVGRNPVSELLDALGRAMN
jgi:hypothetical protein